MNKEIPLKKETPWESFLAENEAALSAHVLDTWLRPIRFEGHKNTKVTLAVPDQFFRDWLTDHYLDFIQEGLSKKLETPIKIEWEIDPSLTTPGNTLTSPTKPEEMEEELVFVEPVIERATTAFGRSIPNESNSNSNTTRRHLNARYTFDAFVGGPSNQFALAAATAVANQPGESYNPLFLFGGVGLGKTHLLSAVGHQILAQTPSARIVYTSSEQFTNEVVNAVLGGKLEDFRSKYRRNCDVLLIDDIQLLAGKERTQHELFHVFNALYDSRRQIVVTSDKLPHEIPDIEERLRNRFQWGLIADIQPPEIETRVAILRQKAKSENIDLADDVAFFLAKSVRSNVRELEGVLVRLLAHASLTGNPITEPYAKSVLAELLIGRSNRISVESIQSTTASYFHVKVSDLKSKRRQKSIVRPRQVAMYLCRKHTGSSFPDIGTRFGNKDHTTVMNACKRVETMLTTDPSLRSQILDLERKMDVTSPR